MKIRSSNVDKLSFLLEEDHRIALVHFYKTNEHSDWEAIKEKFPAMVLYVDV